MVQRRSHLEYALPPCIIRKWGIGVRVIYQFGRCIYDFPDIKKGGLLMLKPHS